MVCDFASRATGHVGSPSCLHLIFLSRRQFSPLVWQESVANRETFFAEPTLQLLHKLQAPCPGLSLTPSRRTPSRAMSSYSTVSETNCKRVTHRSLSCRVATLLVRLPPLHIPPHHSTVPHQVVIWLPHLKFERIYPQNIPLKRKLEEKCLFGFLYSKLHCMDRCFFFIFWLFFLFFSC